MATGVVVTDECEAFDANSIIKTSRKRVRVPVKWSQVDPTSEEVVTDVMSLCDGAYFPGHQSIHELAEQRDEVMRGINITQEQIVNLDMSPLKKLLSGDIMPVSCSRNKTLSEYVVDYFAAQQNMVSEMMAINLDGKLAPVFFKERKRVESCHCGHEKIPGTHIHSTGAWLCVPTSISGQARPLLTAPAGEKYLDTVAIANMNFSTQMLCLDFVAQTRGLAPVRCDFPLRTSTLLRPGELMFFEHEFDELVRVRRLAQPHDRLTFKYKVESFTKQYRREFGTDMIGSLRRYEAVLKAQNFKDMILAATGVTVHTDYVEDHVEDVYKDNADPEEWLPWFPCIWNQGSIWNKMHSSAAKNHPEEAKFHPCRGFWEMQAALYSLLAGSMPKRSTRAFGRLAFAKFLTDNLLVWGHIDRAQSFTRSTIRWCVFWLNKGQATEIQVGKAALWQIEERLQHASELIGVCTLMDPYSVPFLYANLQALHPTRFTYDLGLLTYLAKSDHIAYGAPTSGWKTPLMTLLSKKADGGGPKSMRDVLLCDMCIWSLVYSTPAEMFMNKVLGAPTRNSRFSFWDATVKMCRAKLQYERGEMKIDNEALSAFHEWFSDHIKAYFDKEAVQAFSASHQITLNDCVTMNASVSIDEAGHVRSDASANTLYSMLSQLVLENAADVPSLAAGEYVVEQLIQLVRPVFTIFAKEQANGERPIATYNAAGRSAFGVINQIADMLGQGQKIDLCTRAELKDNTGYSHVNWRRKKQREGCLTGTMFLDISNFCGSMPYDLCIDIMTQICDYCFPSGANVSARTLLFNKLLHYVEKRFWLIKRSDVTLPFLLDVYKPGDWYTEAHSKLLYQKLIDEPEPWKVVFSKCLKVIMRSNTGEEREFDGEPWDEMSNLTVVWREQIPSYSFNGVEEKGCFVAPDFDHFYIKLDHGSEEGQVMYIESIAFAMILEFAMSLLEVPHLINDTSDDVIISFALPPTEVTDGGVLWDRTILQYGTELLNKLCEILAMFHIPLSKEKCSINVDAPSAPDRSQAISFNSREISFDSQDPYCGRMLNNLGRLTRGIFIVSKHLSTEASLEAMRSGMIDLVHHVPYLTDDEIERFSRAQKMCSIFSWGCYQYPQLLEAMCFDSGLWCGCPSYSTRNELYQDVMCHEIEVYPKAINVTTPDEHGFFKLDQKAMRDTSRIDEFRQLKDQCIEMLKHASSLPLAADFIYNANIRSKAIARQVEFYHMRLPARFGPTYADGITLVEALNKPPRLPGAFNPLAKAIMEGSIQLSSGSRFCYPKYSGSCPLPNSVHVFQYMRTLQALTTEHQIIPSSEIEQWVATIERLSGDQGKCDLIFATPSDTLLPLDTHIKDELFSVSTSSAIAGNLLPLPVMANNPIGATFVYNQKCNGSWLVGRDSVMVAKIDCNGEVHEPDFSDFLANRAWFTDMKAGYVDKSTVDRIQFEFFGKTAVHGSFSVLAETDSKIRRTELLSQNYVTSVGFQTRDLMDKTQGTIVDSPLTIVTHEAPHVKPIYRTIAKWPNIEPFYNDLKQLEAISTTTLQLDDSVPQTFNPLDRSTWPQDSSLLDAFAEMTNGRVLVNGKLWILVFKCKEFKTFRQKLTPAGGGIADETIGIVQQQLQWQNLATRILRNLQAVFAIGDVSQVRKSFKRGPDDAGSNKKRHKIKKLGKSPNPDRLTGAQQYQQTPEYIKAVTSFYT